LLIVLTILLVWILPTTAMALPPGFGEAHVVAGFDNLEGPTAVAYAPDGRTFVAEKAGRVRVVNPGSETASTVIDLSAKVNDFSDRGMTGIAVDTEFASNGYLYLLYTLELDPDNPDTDAPMVSRLTRVTVAPGNSLVLPPGSSDPETVILGKESDRPCPEPDNTRDCITADFYWHNVGTVRVDPADGTLWVGSGDSHRSSVDEYSWRTYDPTSFAGKIIHIDRSGRGLPDHPFCPEDTNLDHVCTKIYAMGFRNPFRFHLRPGKGPVVGDVGNGSKEEVDFLQPGRNYGWPCYEGTLKPSSRASYPECQALYAKEGTPEGATPPSWEYDHTAAGASVTVGPIYDGWTYPTHFRGDLFVGDFVQGWIKRLEIDEQDRVTAVHEFSNNWIAGVDLEMHPSGDLSDVRFYEPTVTRYTYSGGTNSPPTVVARATPDAGAPPLTVEFTGSDSSDPDDDELTFDWDFGDGSGHSSEADPVHLYEELGEYTARLTVTDSEDNESSRTVRVLVTPNQAPTATIESPGDESFFRAGTPVALTGSGSDPEDGELTGQSLQWQVLLHHNTHVHTLTAPSGGATSFTPLTDHDADSHYEIRLTATDSGGRSSSQTIELRPETSDVELASSPPGAPLAYDDRELPAPYSTEAAVGYRAQITAPQTFERGGRTYRFAGWSNGGARSHSVQVPPGSPQFTATYRVDDAETLEFEPVADTHVHDAEPDWFFGTDTEVLVDGGPSVRQAFLKFDVEGIEGRQVIGARLALQQVDAPEGSPYGGDVHAVASSAWDETMTWTSKPGLGTKLASFGPAVFGRGYEVDLGASAVAADGLVSLGMASPHTDGSGWASRESDAPPRLILEVRRNACDDGEDDDGDGAADFPADLGCMSATDDDENQAPAASADATPVTGDAPLEVAFGSAGSVDAEGHDLSYEWDFGDGSPVSTEAAPQHLYESAGAYTATLTVTDEHGGSDSDTVQIRATAPVDAGGGGDTSPGQSTPTGTGTPEPPSPFGGVRIGTVAFSRGAASLRLACAPSAAGSCTGRLSLATSLRVARRRSGQARSRTVGLGVARFSIGSSKSARVRVELTARGRRLLARRGRLKVSARATAHDGLMRKRVTTASLLLERPARSRAR
jgi:PKD repeat protein